VSRRIDLTGVAENTRQLELEFSAQFLVLCHGPDEPRLRTTDTRLVLATAIEIGVLDEPRGHRLLQAFDLLHALQAVLRLSTTGRSFDPTKAPPGLKEALVRAANRQLDLGVPVTHFDAIQGLLVESETLTAQYFDELCPPDDDPSGAVAGTSEASKQKEAP